MNLKPAQCPTCGAHLELSDVKNNSRCEYCGGTVIVREAVKANSSAFLGYKSYDYVDEAIQTYEAQELRDKWGNKDCDHPRIGKEFYRESPTGDYCCITCGENFVRFLVNCPVCHSPIASQAEFCPRCGEPNPIR